jgi:small subunit ribosomal protein S20
MATHASAEKRNRQRIKRTTRNRSVKSALKTTLKKARAAAAGAEPAAKDLVREAASELDRAAKKGVIPKKRAARLKGRMAAAVQRAQKK